MKAGVEVGVKADEKEGVTAGVNVRLQLKSCRLDGVLRLGTRLEHRCTSAALLPASVVERGAITVARAKVGACVVL